MRTEGRRLNYLSAYGACYFGNLADILPLAASTISQHVSVLKQAGLLDRHGGRRIMGMGSVLCGIGLVGLGAGRTPLAYLVAWSVLGLAMGMTLYEAAFATVNRRYAGEGRRVISTLTLFAGFASTIFWPLTQALDAAWGWRATYFWYAALQFLVCLPLHLLLGGEAVRPAAAPRHERRSHTLAAAVRAQPDVLGECAASGALDP